MSGTARVGTYQAGRENMLERLALPQSCYHPEITSRGISPGLRTNLRVSEKVSVMFGTNKYVSMFILLT